VAEAPDHIAGYTSLCDWTARDRQAREMTVGLGPAKGSEFVTQLGVDLHDDSGPVEVRSLGRTILQ
jgi:2-keto-4-pentenoate hydratase/2-oxohepta-3-ene-1,7-dioic acid hydratase in catechol pathway